MAIRWKDSYKIGDADIDEQHILLFANINLFLEARDKASQTLCAMGLYQYAREHFAHEETLMRALQYPALKVHIEQHTALLTRLNAVSAAIAGDTLNKAELESFLVEWTLSHIRTFDTKLASFIRARSCGPKPDTESTP
ncbi:MAG: bacteriohemerythrin [Rhodoferax sp.]|nr:bacteriohemerythrin [Rhodoferax sp.]MCF8210341.1 bacteriohemerythrin [Rhodoferax sp.]